jgi:Ni/Fe-hydrogenase subunit HybB-like protein
MNKVTGQSLVIEDSMRSLRKSSLKFWIAIALLSIVVAVGIFAWITQLRQGMGVAGYSDRAFWAVYIANVVAFIGFSYGGAVVSAILLLTGAPWRGPLARLAEGMALVTVIIGALFILPHLGRPDRLVNMFTHANPRSPVFWDMVAITTYSFATLVFFLLPLIPDLAILRGERPDELGRFRLFVYRLVSNGWVGSFRQRKALHKATVLMAILIIPLAVSVHSVLSWAFALVSRPGWHESIWAPYFVIAALYSGVALAILVIAGFRKGYRLEAHIQTQHFVRLGYIMVALGAIYAYLTFADMLPSAYVGEKGPVAIIYGMLMGKVALEFWFFLVTGTIIPILLIAIPRTRNIAGMVVASGLVVFAMWIKRMMMIIETSDYDRLTMSFGTFFHFTWVSIATTLAGVAAVPLLLMLLFHVFPVLAIDEMAHLSGAKEQPEIAEEEVSQRGFRGRKAGAVAGIMLMTGLAAVGVGRAMPAYAATSVPPTIVVSAVANGVNVDVTATATSEGKPAPDLAISFYASSAMYKQNTTGPNRFLFGMVSTDASGVAKSSYVSAEIGQVTISAEYFFNVEENPALGTAQVQVTKAVTPYVKTPPRILEGAGQVLVKMLFSVVLLIFITVIVQFVRIRRVLKAPKEAVHSDSVG